MATIKLGTTKADSRLINYAEKRAEQKQGINCPTEYARAQMKATRELWGKEDGIQAHHVIQSFKPEETTAEQANEIGKQLAEKIAPGHECVIYTHADKEHIHNHVVINSVNFETGHKYQAHGKKAIEDIRDASDQLCLEHDLSVVKEPSAEIRYTLAEQGLLEKGRDSWKDEIRQSIDLAKEHVTDLNSLKSHLEAKYGVEMKLRGKTISFKHPDRGRFVRANKLGLNYERGELERGFETKNTRGSEFERTFERNPGIEQVDDGLHSGPDERGNGEGLDDREPTRANPHELQRHHHEHAINLGKAGKTYREKQRSLAQGFDRWTQSNAGEQQANPRENEPNRKEQRQSVNEHEREDGKQREQHAEQAEPSCKRSQERERGISR